MRMQGMSKVSVTELLDFGDAKDLRITGDGYLVANPRIARSGIQIYRGIEVGIPDMDVVRVFRPEDEVFHLDALASLAHRPVTNNHPPDKVDAKNWRKFAIGSSGGDVARDGDCIRVPMLVMDSDAIDDVQNGKAQLSVGYSADLIWGDGVTQAGENYDAKQTNIRANHIAIVAKARGGTRLKLGDHRSENDKPRKGKAMRLLVDGINVEIEDETHGEIVVRRIKTLEDNLTKTAGDVTRLTADITTLQGSVQTKDAEIVTLKKQVTDAALTPQKMDELVKARQDMIGVAKKMLGDALIIDGRTDADIRKQCVTSYLGAAQVAGWNDDQVSTSFATIAAMPSNKPGPNGAGFTARDAAPVFFRTGHGYTELSAAEKAYQDNVTDMENAWKSPARRAAEAAANGSK